ncbi:dentin sialophosphoprotein [Bactrocera dorsalis]|uniref:Dentin sialophosphoprotein n=1 Tax=Bactrocera dorsalis TaxID=27457 RepID=A0ABM3JB42_BACDO|nr:dentin sialophosphoprotein [Bactrocera dorsalis]
MENLEDTSTGGRVTRSLRKRLTSVDSDASSRPSTPQLTKLTSIPETSSPSRTLRGRRNSTTLTATPSKTPAKSKTSTINESNEAEYVPAKRTTRKSSVSAADLHTPTLDKLQLKENETNEINTRGTPARRTRRLTSQTEVEKTPRSTAARKKPGPKSRRSKQDSESDSDIEVINLEDEPTDSKEKVNSTTPIVKDQSMKTPVRTSPRLKAKSISPKENTDIETIDLSEDIKTSHDTEECDSNSTVSNQKETNESLENPDTKMESFGTNEEKEVELENLESSLTEDAPVKETVPKNLSNKSDSFDHNDAKVEDTAKIPPETLSSLNSSEAFVESVHNDVKVNTTATSPHTSLSPLNSSKAVVESVVMLQKLSPKVIDKICNKTSAVSSPPNSKSVTFTDIEVDDEVKSSYPKTPASIKRKSYIDMDSTNDSKDQSFQSDKESNGSYKDASAKMETSKDQSANDSKESVEFHDAANDVEEINNSKEENEIVRECTPQKRKLSTKLQSSTPMLDSVSNSKTDTENLVTNSPIITNTLEEMDTNADKASPVKQDETITSQHDQKDLTTNDKNVSLTVASTNLSNGSEKKDDLFSKSWTHNVSGCATSDGKIDTLVVTANDKDSMPQPLKVEDESNTSPNVDTRKELPKENDEPKEEEEEEEEDAESFQKLEFVDDEAMEVDDNYQSGDSMDEEERKEMLENEIVDEGESIGSEDTEESNEEDDEDNASFITSDSEESLLEYSDIDEGDDEHLEDNAKNSNKKKSCNRILITSESEDDGNPNISRTNSEKTKKINRSNQRNRILSSSESETEQTETEQINGKQVKIQTEQMNGKPESSDNSEKPLTFEVSRMIDDTTDDDGDAKDASKPQHAMEATVNTESKCSNDQESKPQREENTQENDKSDGIVNDSSNKKNSQVEQETRSGTKLNTSLKWNPNSETANDNGISETVESTMSSPTQEMTTNGQKGRRSKSLSKSICEKMSDDNNDYEETHKESTECDKEDNNKSMERSIRKSISSGHKSNKTTETIEDVDIISTETKNVSSNDSDSSENTNARLIVDEGSKSNDLDDLQSQNESNNDEDIDDEDIEIPETQEVGQALEEESTDESLAEETVEELTIGKSGPKLKNSGLSLSFCQAKQKRITVKDRIRHSSFSIGVCVTKTEDINQMEASDSSEAEEKEKSLNSDGSGQSRIDKQDEEELEKLAHSISPQFPTQHGKRKSMSAFAQDNQEYQEFKKKSKRNSLQSISNEDFNPSKSLLENIEEQKRELENRKFAKKSRLSKSFCDPIQDEMETLADSGVSDDASNKSEKCNRKSLQSSELGTHSTKSKSRLSKSFCDHIQDEMETLADSGDSDVANNTHSEKSNRKSLHNTSKSRLSKSFCGPIQEQAKSIADSSYSEDSADELTNKEGINGSTPREVPITKNKKKDFGRVLDRCDEILDAANRAKLESKQNYKKSRLIIPKSKKESKHSLRSDEESANDAPVLKKDMKPSKEKTALAWEQAVKASAKILLKEASKAKKEKPSLPINQEKYDDKRLPMKLLESISDSQSHTETKKSKRERAREPLVQRLNCITGEIVEEVLSPPKKKRAILNRIELPTGTVLEEPVTPKKKINNSGFRESPITPRTLGFKVRHILTAGQDKVPQLPTSHSIGRKRKQKIVDPKLVLPKPQWSQSGVFLEEVLPTPKIQGMDTMLTCGPGVNASTLNALNFKTSTLFRNNVPREASHELLKRKERQYVRSRF